MAISIPMVPYASNKGIGEKKMGGREEQVSPRAIVMFWLGGSNYGTNSSRIVTTS